MPRYLLLASILVISLACKQSGKVYYGGYVVGVSNDILPVNSENQSKIPSKALNGSVLIATHTEDGKVKFCSGFLLTPSASGKTQIVTNHHCFAQTSGESDVSPDFIPEACTNTHVYFALTKANSSEAKPSACAAGTLRSHFAADIAIFTLAGAPPAGAIGLDLWKGADPAPAGRNAVIVHYPDVSDNLVTIAAERARLPLASVTQTDCQTGGVFKAEQFHLDHSLVYGLKHTCDIVHGSSGSALIDVETSTVLGINWGGIKVKSGDNTETFNVATRARYITAFLEKDDKTLSTPIQAQSSEVLATEDEKAQSAEDQKEQKNLGASVKQKACGVIGYHDQKYSWVLKVFLLLPLAFLIFRRRRSGH